MYDKLKVFQAVAMAESISGAAQKLRRTQPAISQQIALLEEELGFRLFDRRRNRVFLSSEGKSLVGVLGECFERIDSEIASLREELGKVEGKIKVGFLHDHSTPFDLAEVLVEFSTKYPLVDFAVTMGTNQEIEARLNREDIDLAISVVFEDKVPFHRELIHESKHILVCGAELYKDVQKKSVAKIVQEHRLVDFSEEFLCLTPWIKKNAPEASSALKEKRPSVVVPNHIETLKIILKQWAVAILPEYLCADQLKKGTVKKVRPNSAELTVGLDVAYLRRRTLKRSEKLFIDFILAKHRV